MLTYIKKLASYIKQPLKEKKGEFYSAYKAMALYFLPLYCHVQLKCGEIDKSRTNAIKNTITSATNSDNSATLSSFHFNQLGLICRPEHILSAQYTRHSFSSTLPELMLSASLSAPLIPFLLDSEIPKRYSVPATLPASITSFFVYKNLKIKKASLQLLNTISIAPPESSFIEYA